MKEYILFQLEDLPVKGEIVEILVNKQKGCKETIENEVYIVRKGKIVKIWLVNREDLMKAKRLQHKYFQFNDF